MALTLQPIQPVAQLTAQPDQQPLALRKGSDWLTSAEAAEYLRFPSVAAFRLWRRRHGIEGARRGYRGRALLFLRADLDAALGLSRRLTKRLKGQR
jgi:hypothetical protein